jgi:hypothetical protein
MNNSKSICCEKFTSIEVLHKICMFTLFMLFKSMEIIYDLPVHMKRVNSFPYKFNTDFTLAKTLVT